MTKDQVTDLRASEARHPYVWGRRGLRTRVLSPTQATRGRLALLQMCTFHRGPKISADESGHSRVWGTDARLSVLGLPSHDSRHLALHQMRSGVNSKHAWVLFARMDDRGC